jgi:HD-like signal output (HDOD) protein/ActR/RegA family two-component response regulator
MAYILLLDENEVAGRAMQGILARGDHSCIIAANTEDAWRILREGVIIDLVFVELKLAKGDGIAFLQRVRDDWFWKNLPVVIYTYDTDAKQVRKALGLRVQNYLVKPYNDQHVHAEIAKARLNPWRTQLFEEPKSFCAQMGLTPDTLGKMRRQVMVAFTEAAKVYPGWATQRENTELFAQIDALVHDAEAAGIWAGVDYLQNLRAQAEVDNWDAFKNSADYFNYAARLIFCQLNPAHVPDCLVTDKDREEVREATERARWSHIDVDANGPIITAAEIEKEVLALPSWPVIDTAAAGFQMAADGRAASMTAVMELVSIDPGLCAQVLTAANKVEHDDMTVIEDPKAAVTMLGEIKLNKLAKALPLAYERHLNQTSLTWASYWMFLVSVAKMSEFICRYLEFTYLSGSAFTAGLMHDLGKLVLLRLHPFGFQAILRYAQEKRLPLHRAEKLHIDCTSRDLGVKFAEATGLPPLYTNVIRWVEQPNLATEHTELVAMVSLARHVALHNRLGHCGDTPGDSSPPIANTPAWRALQPSLFPSFDLKKFEAQAHAYCIELRKELSNRGVKSGHSSGERKVAATVAA